MSKIIQLVALAGLNLKAGTQFREKLDADAVKDYTQRLKEWLEANTTGPDPADPNKRVKLAKVPPMEEWTKCPLPPITVFETKDEGTINADGFHRIKGALAAGLETYPAEVKAGTKQDAVVYALQANSGHGVRLSNEDKQNKLKAALKIEAFKELSNNALAGKIGVSEFFVRTNKPASATKGVVTTAAGKKMSTKNVGKKGGNTAKKKAAAKKANKKGAAATTGTGDTKTDEEKALEAAMGGGASGEAGGGTSTEPAGKKFDDETESALARIVKAVNEAKLTDGAKLEEAIRGGTIEISTRDLRAFAQTSPERMVLAYPLVFGDKRMKPAAAFAFLDKVPDADMKLGHLFNLTAARRGIVSEKAEGFRIFVVPDDKGFVILENKTLGSFFIVPAANKDAALKAIKEA